MAETSPTWPTLPNFMRFLRYRYFDGFGVSVPIAQIASRAARFEVEQKGPRSGQKQDESTRSRYR
jgi:hypothetical protein